MKEKDGLRADRDELFFIAVREVSRALVSTEDLDEMLSLVADRVADVAGNRWVVLLIFEPESSRISRIVLGGSHTHEIDARGFTWDEAMEGLTGWVVRTGKAALSPSTPADPRESESVQRRRRLNRCGSIIVAPLTVSGRVYGTLTAINRVDEREFDEIDCEYISILADQASSALATRMAADRLAKANREKELLLREAYHRIKNNLQMITSLVRIQMSSSDNNELRAALQVVESRISSMAEVHEALYQSDESNQLRGEIFLGDLIEGLKDSFHESLAAKNIKVETDLGPGSMGFDQALAIGLIVNELVTNAVKYAFGNGPGAIKVTLKRRQGDRGEQGILSVEDNGQGMPSITSFDRSQSLGITVVEGMVDKLDGTYSVETDSGTAWTIVFPEVCGENQQ